jgi:hypothetical protein
MLGTKFLWNNCLLVLLCISKFMCTKSYTILCKSLCSRWRNWRHFFVLGEWTSLQFTCDSGPPLHVRACVLQRQTQPSTIHYWHQQDNNYTIHKLNCYISRVVQHSKVHKMHKSVTSSPATPRSNRRVSACLLQGASQAFTVPYLPLCTSRSYSVCS